MGTIAVQRLTVHVLPYLYKGLESIQAIDVTKGSRPPDRKVY
jgi:hypothetical protein